MQRIAARMQHERNGRLFVVQVLCQKFSNSIMIKKERFLLVLCRGGVGGIALNFERRSSPVLLTSSIHQSVLVGVPS